MRMYTLTLRSVLMLLLSVGFIACKGNKESKEEETTEEVAENAEEAPEYTGDLPLDRLNLPEGFSIDVYAENIEGARSMAMGTDGTLFVGTRNEGSVYALKDVDGDYRVDETYTIATDLEQPNGMAFRDGALYVAAVSRLYKYSDIESQLENPAEPELIYDDYPTEFHHGWKYIAFGPDDKLYVPVGAPCNICDRTDEDERFGTITRMDPDGSNREIVAHGVRNTVGFTWHPDTNELWFTDNGRDMMGDDVPPGELNKLTEVGQHFGYPFCHGGTVKDPEFGDQRPCSDFVPPVQQLGAHVAALGVKFAQGPMFPDAYTGQAFLAEHGSWNRSSKVGYRVSLVTLENGEAVSYEPFIDGWLDEASQEAFGRPVDLLFLEDGSLLISDDEGNAIYRVTYKG
ncbi:MAG: PQQ-dependent sugar dehydrogenase [Bacteroidota bacterium]|uniref:Sorbosone dehydrogenase family protein n=1 Tax=Flagellimonas profundi TaxID=2915620 RepID=A0ABS3FEK2_9FLAO|nr:PQQ-dependent sugar dehydrogenase [Allomuricauda profundi]MBO0341021.1 sorbosone dehydrogenase family protein [Allomuricauda profundi]MEC7771834.1 PQQ-dependent sugar dehydrogenase [Bacteroidota bacterium]